MERYSRVTIDKVSITGNPYDDWIEGLKGMVKNRLIATKGLYKYFIMLECGSIVQTGRITKNIKDMRVEFNPKNCDVRVLKFIKEYIKPKSKCVTRLDIAIDLQENINDWVIIDTRGVEQVIYFDRKREKTGYVFGSQNSDTRKRVYDKKKELKKKKGIELKNELLRIEVQRRYKDGQKLDELLEDNLFDSILMLKPVGKINDRALIEYIKNHPECISELSEHNLKKLKSIGRQENFIDLSKIYNLVRGELRKEVEYYLQEENVQIINGLDTFNGANMIVSYDKDNFLYREVNNHIDVPNFEEQQIFV
jgi:hypothetical protein